MDLLRYFEKKHTQDIRRPRLRPGDIVRVETRIQEGEKSRLQTFEGTVLGIRGSGPSATLTVRREVSGFAVERIFPLYSPLITNIEITKRQKVRRAKLSYLRQAGRRRVKEDYVSMQRHVREEEEQKRLAEEKKKREEEEALRQAQSEAKKETEKLKAEKAQAQPEQPVESKPAEENAEEKPAGAK